VPLDPSEGGRRRHAAHTSLLSGGATGKETSPHAATTGPSSGPQGCQSQWGELFAQRASTDKTTKSQNTLMKWATAEVYAGWFKKYTEEEKKRVSN